MTASIFRPTTKLKKSNTLQLLRYGWYTTWATSLLLLVVSILGINQQRQAIKTVGKDAVPSILSAQQLRDSYADLDASLANELLLKPGQNQQVLADFEKNLQKIADRSVAAARNITYPAEETIVKKLQFNGSGYLLKLQEARDAHSRNDTIGALNFYRSAAGLVDREILPLAEQLDAVNSQELENTYSHQGFINGSMTILIAILGLVQLIILVRIQLFLDRRMHRKLNLPLIIATTISAIFLLYTISSLIGAASDLKVAKEDAFESIHALRQARALSYKANGDESRYLLDTANADLHERSFKTKIGQIITLPPKTSLADIIKEIPQTDREVKFKLAGLSGLYANQLNNITFDGELAATLETLKTFDEYLKIDVQIRQLYRSGKLAEAIALCTGSQPGQSNWAFEKYKNANEKLRKINEGVFYSKIESGTNRLNYFEIIAPVALGGVAILTLFGLRPRLAEYL